MEYDSDDDYDAPIVLKYKRELFRGSIDKILGSGGFGKIYRYSANKAIKVMEWSNTTGPNETTILEIAILKKYRHPNLVRIYDVVLNAYDHTRNKGLGLVMELAKYDLRSAIKQGIDKKQKDKFLYDIMSGLSFLHHHNIMHRDIKPPNILIFEKDGEEIAKITDVGASVASECLYNTTFSSRVYTLWYRPIEILLGNDYNISADVWALGCTIYELYSGTVLFKEYTDIAMINLIFNQLGTPSVSLFPSNTKYINKTVPTTKKKFDYTLPVVIEYIVTECLQYDPSKRPNVSDLLLDPYFTDFRDPKYEYRLRPCIDTISDKDIIVNRPDTQIKDLQGWIIEMSFHFKLSSRIIFMSLKILDLVVERTSVDNLLVLGCIALHLGSILSDEVITLDIPDYIKLIERDGKVVTDEYFIELMVLVLSELQFDLLLITPYDYRIAESAYEITFANIHKSLLYIIALSDIRYGKTSSYLNTLAHHITGKYKNKNKNIPILYRKDVELLFKEESLIGEIVFKKFTTITYEELKRVV